MVVELHQRLKREDILEYKRFKMDTFRKTREVSRFSEWLTEQGYMGEVYLPMYIDEDNSYDSCLMDYFTILHSLDELSVMDTLESGFGVIRNKVKIVSENLVGGETNKLCLYTQEYERILKAKMIKYLIFDLEQFTCFNS